MIVEFMGFRELAEAVDGHEAIRVARVARPPSHARL
jgi:hypothetical protein